MAITRVPGNDKGDILIYALSTCGWCRKTKTMLEELGIEYCFVDVDQTEGEEREEIAKEMRTWNPAMSFPTVVINKDKCIVGFKEDRIKEALGL